MPSRDEGDGLTAVATAALASVAAAGERAPLVLIDGRSGAGKSTLARELRRRWPGEVDVLPLDALYPGWDGLAAASVILAEDVLSPRAEGRPGRWRRWDWEADRVAEEHVVSPQRALIVEGAGALTATTAQWATVSVWLDAPEELRRRRAMARDGETYAPHWRSWAAQEERHIRTHRPAELADLGYGAEPSTACTSASSR